MVGPQRDGRVAKRVVDVWEEGGDALREATTLHLTVDAVVVVENVSTGKGTHRGNSSWGTNGGCLMCCGMEFLHTISPFSTFSFSTCMSLIERTWSKID